MAFIDEAEIDAQDILALSSKPEFLFLAKRVLWKEFEKHKNESHKGKLVGIIPYSIKIAKAEPYLEKFLGANPFHA